MNTQWSKWISLAVIAGLLSAYTPAPATAEEAVNPPSNVPSQVTDSHAKDILKEVDAKREANVKHFLLKDKTYEAVVYPESVHYKVNGKWTDIDNTLVDSADSASTMPVVENKANNWNVQFAKSTKNKNLVQLKASGYTIQFGLDDANESRVSTSTLIPDGYSKWSAKQKQQALLQLTSTATYSEILPYVDLQYVVSPDKLKENIVLQSAHAPATYSFTIKAPRLDVALQDGVLTCTDKQNPEHIVFQTQAPYMVDANGEMSTDVGSTLSEQGNTYTLRLDPSSTWLHDPQRAFPVTIDPTFSVAGSSQVTDTFVASNFPTANYNSSILMRAGNSSYSGTTRTFLKFNVPNMGASSFLLDAELNLTPYSALTTSAQVNAYKVNADWNGSTITYANQPSYDGNRVFDYSQVSNATGAVASWNITELAQQWMVNGQNYGLMLRANAESSTFTDFYSTDNASEVDRPFATFSYLDAVGVEDYWTYHTQNIGRAGTSSVNDITGNLVFIHPDTASSGALLPVSVSHVYNLTNAGDATNPNRVNAGYGVGWRLNYSQQLASVGPGTYSYVDEDGTTHFFVQSTRIMPDGTQENKFTDESGLNLSMTIQATSTTERYLVKDKSDSTLSFNANGKLTFIRDAIGNTQALTYTGTNLTTIMDGSGRVTTLVYDAAGQLTQIKDPANRTTTYGYTNGDLTSITYPDGEVSAYVYDSSHAMTEAKGIDGYRLNYGYTSTAPKRVNQVSEPKLPTVDPLNPNQKLDITYGSYKTAFRTYNPDGTFNDEIYQYDQDGHTTSVRDNKGNGSYTAYSTAAGATKHKLTAQSKLQRVSTNLLLNHNFENTDTWTSGSEYGDTGTQSYSTVANIGSTAVAITKTNYLGSRYWKQTVTVQAGKTYTLSGFIKTSGLSTSSSSGASLAIRYTDSTNNVVTVQSDPVSGTQNYDRYDTSVTLPATLGSTTATVLLQVAGTTGTAYFDNIQLEQSDTPSRYNIVENADMTATTTLANGSTFPLYYGQNSGSAQSNVYTTRIGGPPQLDNKTVGINGVAGERKNVFQEIKVSGQAGDKYTYGAWSIGDAVPEGNGRYYALWLIFYNTDGSTTYEMNSFNDEVYDWQYLAASAVADKPYSKIRIYGIYYLNQNNAWFDGFQLYKEPFERTFDYDADGNVTGTTEIDGSTEQFGYNTTNDATSYIDENGNTSTAVYNTRHQVTSSTSPTGVVTQNSYNSTTGNLTATNVTGTEGKSITQAMTYTADGNYVATSTDTRGKVVTNTYDSNRGTLLTVTDPNGNVSTNTYDPNNDNLLSVSKSVDGQVASNTYTYSKDRLTSIMQNGTSIDFGYGAYGDNTSVSVGGNPLVTNTFEDSSHLLTQTQFANGNQVSLTYDNLDRLTKKTLGGGTAPYFAYAYDNDGNVSKIKDSATGDFTRLDYDAMGRVTRTYDQDRNTLYYGYNVAGQLSNHTFKSLDGTFASSFTYTDSGAPKTVTSAGRTVTYNYDSLDRQTSTSIGFATPYLVSMSYLAGNGTNKTSVLVSSYANGNDWSYAYTYDNLGNISSVVTNKWIYTYPAGWVIDQTYTTSYSYNELSELVRENDQENNRTILYSYDLGGNIRTKKQYPYSTGTPSGLVKQWTYNYANASWTDLLTSVTTTTYSGGVGTSTTDQVSYANGQAGKVTGLPSQMGGNALTWTWGNELSTVENTSQRVSYTYNDAGIRTSKSVLNKTSGVTTTSTYVLDGDKVVFETVGANKLHYSYNSAGDLVSVNFNGAEYYYIYNAQGDVVGLVDTSGTQVVRYNYDAFGNALSITGSLSGASQVGGMNPYRYKGYRYDTDTKWYYLQSRYYSPELSRFVSSDFAEILSLTTGVLLSHNLFAYCSNNPINLVDLNGHWFVVDDAFTGPTDEIVVLLGLYVLSTCGVEWAKNAQQTVYDIIGDSITSATRWMQSKDSSKNEKHGDSGKQMEKAKKQIEELEKELAKAKTKAEKTKIAQKIKNIINNARKAKKGEEHSRTKKR